MFIHFNISQMFNRIFRNIKIIRYLYIKEFIIFYKTFAKVIGSNRYSGICSEMILTLVREELTH